MSDGEPWQAWRGMAGKARTFHARGLTMATDQTEYEQQTPYGAMTVSALQDAKRMLQANIARQLREFCRSTGASIRRVDIRELHRPMGDGAQAHSVSIELDL